MRDDSSMNVEPDPSPNLVGANWLLQLARVIRGLKMLPLLELLTEEVKAIRRDPRYIPDEHRLVMRDAARGVLMERVMTSH